MIKRKYVENGAKKVIHTRTLVGCSQEMVGKRVILAKLHEDWNYGESNPTWGKHAKFIKGTIVKYNKDNTLKLKVKWDNGKSNNYYAKYLDEIIKGEEKPMLEKAKDLAKGGYDAVKPYEKYLGLIALAVVIDHFFMGNKYTDKFKELADRGMKKIMGTVEDAVDSICGDDKKDTTEETTTTQETATDE